MLNAAREESQYKQQLLQTQMQMVSAFYKLQIDLGQMPWQRYEPAPIPPVTIKDAVDTAIFNINPRLAPPKAVTLPTNDPSEPLTSTPLFIDDEPSDTPIPIFDQSPTAGTTL